MRHSFAVALATTTIVALLVSPDTSARAGDGARVRVGDRGELVRLFADRTFYGRYSNGSNFIEYYAPDGRVGYWDGCPHMGQWRIDAMSDGAFACFYYPTMAPPGPHCFDVFRASDRLEFSLRGGDPSGPAQAWTRMVRPGNPEQMSLTDSGCQISGLERDAIPAAIISGLSVGE
ncbi:MAG: hypothetical protein IT563_12470 [Alphaproteobacteria bacterium]|nr:hypothetical protein [Alphaproteobacteria bacterium]